MNRRNSRKSECGKQWDLFFLHAVVCKETDLNLIQMCNVMGLHNRGLWWTWDVVCGLNGRQHCNSIAFKTSVVPNIEDEAGLRDTNKSLKSARLSSEKNKVLQRASIGQGHQTKALTK